MKISNLHRKTYSVSCAGCICAHWKYSRRKIHTKKKRQIPIFIMSVCIMPWKKSCIVFVFEMTKICSFVLKSWFSYGKHKFYRKSRFSYYSNHDFHMNIIIGIRISASPSKKHALRQKMTSIWKSCFHMNFMSFVWNSWISYDNWFSNENHDFQKQVMISKWKSWFQVTSMTFMWESWISRENRNFLSNLFFPMEIMISIWNS